MTVEPGFGGQKLIPEVLDKRAQLRALGFAGEIEADGGITESNAALLKEAGDRCAGGWARDFSAQRTRPKWWRRVHAL